MAQKLARYVTVAGKTYGPDDDVPQDVLDQIKNPKAFVPQGETPQGQDYSGKEGGTDGGAKLAKPVTVGGKTYSPDDYLPDDVARQIKNPKAWEGGKLPSLGKADTVAEDADQDKAGDGTGDTAVAAAESSDTKAPRKSTGSAAKRP